MLHDQLSLKFLKLPIFMEEGLNMIELTKPLNFKRKATCIARRVHVK